MLSSRFAHFCAELDGELVMISIGAHDVLRRANSTETLPWCSRQTDAGSAGEERDGSEVKLRVAAVSQAVVERVLVR